MNHLLLMVDAISPGRRRRRYYLLELLRHLRPWYDTPDELAAAVGASRAQLELWLQGVGSIPTWTRPMAIAVYHVPPPSWFLIYGPLAMTIAVLASSLAVMLLR